MQVSQAFVEKFSESIVSTLSCHDRVIFKGYLPFGCSKNLNAFVDYELKILRKEFIPLVEQHSQELVDHAKDLADHSAAPYEYHQGKINKEKRVDEIDRDRRHPDGLLAVLCVQETCRTVKLMHGKGRPYLKFVKRPQRVLYYYLNCSQFGRVYIRVQTWFPFDIQVYVNGHEWLARELQKAGVGFVQEDNCFTELDDSERAQEIANQFPHLGWQSLLNKWARLVMPLLGGKLLRTRKYYWVLHQVEYSTDIIFTDRQSLSVLFERLMDYAIINFDAPDVLKFLGRRLHHRFEGEVLTEYRTDRFPGARIKHRVKGNWIKMYDKLGRVLRVETVINQPNEFKVRRWRIRKGERQLVWCDMTKGIANFPNFHAHAHKANQRYLDALSHVADPGKTYQDAETLVQSKRVGKRTFAGFNPAKKQDIELFKAVVQGGHHIRGFRNADIRRFIYGDAKTKQLRHKQSASTGRLLKKLHVRRLIAKIPRSLRWRITDRGQKLLGSMIRLYHHGLAA